jgi:hypothetical protein
MVVRTSNIIPEMREGKSLSDIQPACQSVIQTVNQHVMQSFRQSTSILFFLVVAFFRCYVCHSTMTSEIDRGRISEPALCANCNTNHSYALVHNRSQYTDLQIVKLQESPGTLKCFMMKYLFNPLSGSTSP